MFVYHVKPGGAVLASLEARDPIYERKLDKAGIEFEVTEMADRDAPEAGVLQRAAVREVISTDRAGREVRSQVVQIDREGTVH